MKHIQSCIGISRKTIESFQFILQDDWKQIRGDIMLNRAYLTAQFQNQFSVAHTEAPEQPITNTNCKMMDPSGEIFMIYTANNQKKTKH